MTVTLAPLVQTLGDAEGGRVADVVGVGLEGCPVDESGLAR
ncbi:hypothetical protein [Streptomyces sp. NPDC097610]